MSNEDGYRQIAAMCVRMAEEATEPDSKAAFIAMANAWLTLADQAARNSKADLVYEPPPPKAPKQSVAQQQQQQQQIQPDKKKT